MDSIQLRRPGRTVRDIVRDAARYWEPRRVAYNLALASVALVWLYLTWAQFRTAFDPHSLPALVVLVLIANACYCAGYFPEMVLGRSPFRVAWRRWRWVVWVAGTLLAIALECYWIADEIHPYLG